MRFFYFLIILQNSLSFNFNIHPLEKRCLYINNLKFPIYTSDMIVLKELFNKHPLLIFRNPSKKLSPTEFINFVSNFDDDCDMEALKNPEKYPNQILQPVDRLHDCKHVSLRGNIIKKDFLGNINIDIKPLDPYISKYLWHSDLLGHHEKKIGVVTGFHIMKNPLIGGETDFISGETIYENLDEKMVKILNNSKVIINRYNFAFGNKIMDYSGSYRIKDSDNKFPEYNVKIPILYPPENEYQTPKVLLVPSFIENIVDKTIEETDKIMKYSMEKYVLPHRFSIQWKEGDICVFNNRCFIHSSTPARNYLDLDNNERLLLQTFLPTKKKLNMY